MGLKHTPIEKQTPPASGNEPETNRQESIFTPTLQRKLAPQQYFSVVILSMLKKKIKS